MVLVPLNEALKNLMNDTIITTRCSTDMSLYNEMLSFLNEYDCKKVPYKQQRCSLRYLTTCIRDAIDEDYKWLINIDEDAFILNKHNIDTLIDYMDDNDIVYCGIPDGGSGRLRYGNPLVMNACFNIFNIDLIKDIFDEHKISTISWRKNAESIKSINQQYISTVKTHREDGKATYNWNKKCERYYNLFYHLLTENCKQLYLSHDIYKDNITSIIKFNDLVICYHTWFARFYGNKPGCIVEKHIENVSEEYRGNRIDKVISEVKELRASDEHIL